LILLSLLHSAITYHPYRICRDDEIPDDIPLQYNSVLQCETDQNPNYRRRTNGCGTDSFQFPDKPDPFVDFGPCCDIHDCSYDTCNFVKTNADKDFSGCLIDACNKFYNPKNLLLLPELLQDPYDTCLSLASAYALGVKTYIISTVFAYNPAQKESCNPCNDSKRAIDSTPPGWTCNPSYYNASDGCDCNCGIYDPDCDTQQYNIAGCSDGVNASCLPTGTCYYQYPKYVPSTWVCYPSYYNASDGCDCNCGAWDPDCDRDALILSGNIVYGCGAYNDSTTFSCIKPLGTCIEIDIPNTWVCDPSFYNAFDGCDCNCGVQDPDCSDNTEVIYGCPCNTTMSCKFGACVGECNGYIYSVVPKSASNPQSLISFKLVFILIFFLI